MLNTNRLKSRPTLFCVFELYCNELTLIWPICYYFEIGPLMRQDFIFRSFKSSLVEKKTCFLDFFLRILNPAPTYYL